MKLRIGSTLLFFAAGALAQARPLGNQDIIEMTRLGLGETVVVSKIRSSPSDFDTDPAQLAALKSAGVSDVVVAAMIEVDGSSESAAAQAAADSENIVVVTGGERLPLTAASVEFEYSNRRNWIPGPNFKQEYFIFINGRQADSTVASSRPVLVSKIPASRLRLVHLGQHKRRDSRFVVFSGNASDREIGLQSKQVGAVYELTPATDLADGEYALLVKADVASAPGGIGGLMQVAGAMAPLVAEAYDFDVRAGAAR